MLMNAQQWERFRSTKTYDFISALPLIVWYLVALHTQMPFLWRHFKALYANTLDIKELLQLTAVLSSAIFFLVLIYFLIVRITPVSRCEGILPRVVAILGTMVGSGLFFLPVVNLSLTTLVISNLLIFTGSAMAFVVMIFLGRSFAIMPQARKLVMNGPYALVRHPLYVVEAIILLGAILQFQQPSAFLIWVLVLMLQYSRSVYEESLLETEYPEYKDYKRRTRRFIPGFF